jgi:hypothetical protein
MNTNNKYLSNDKELNTNLPDESNVTEPDISSSPNEQQVPNFIINNDKILVEDIALMAAEVAKTGIRGVSTKFQELKKAIEVSQHA